MSSIGPSCRKTSADRQVLPRSLYLGNRFFPDLAMFMSILNGVCLFAQILELLCPTRRSSSVHNLASSNNTSFTAVSTHPKKAETHAEVSGSQGETRREGIHRGDEGIQNRDEASACNKLQDESCAYFYSTSSSSSRKTILHAWHDDLA